jgi:hypothetical protein
VVMPAMLLQLRVAHVQQMCSCLSCLVLLLAAGATAWGGGASHAAAVAEWACAGADQHQEFCAH